jgi:glycosyltransferase involved in cell wall biosynthesis
MRLYILETRVFALCHITPPHHGAAIVGDEIVSIIEDSFSKRAILNLSSSKSINEVSRLSLNKIYSLFISYCSVVKVLLVKRPTLIYFTPSLNGNAVYRDLLFLLFFRLYQKLKLSRVICHIHMLPTKVERSQILQVLWRFLSNTCEIIVLTPSHEEQLFALGANKTHIISNALFAPGICDIKNVKRNEKKLLFLGHLLESKGFYRFLELGELLDSYEFHIAGQVGGAKEKARLDKALKAYPSRFFYHGVVHGSEKLQLIASSRALILPSFSEAQPLTVIEAFYCGTPVVATNVGGLRDMINDSVGCCAQYENFPQMIEHVCNGNADDYEIKCKDLYNSEYDTEHFRLKIEFLFGIRNHI